MHPSERYAMTAQFLGGYLHQDFDLDYSSADAALEQALSDWDGDERLREVERELRILVTLDDVDLQKTLNQLCDYHPPGDGVTYREWVARVLERVGAASA